MLCAEKPTMVAGRKKQQGSSGAAATPEKESGKGKGKAARVY